MSTDALAPLARQPQALHDRRRTLQGFGLGTIAGLVLTGVDSLAKDRDKKKKRRKKRKRRKQRNNDAPPTCAEQCPAGFDVCFERAADSTLCGETLSTLCAGCFSDQDCVQSDHPYCVGVNGVIDRETDEVTPFLLGFCGPFVDAVCVFIVR